MASSTNICGLILLGNSGVGKSFLANCILNDENAFESRFSVRSVTHVTEWKQIRGLNHYVYDVANIPGLIEANQQLVDRNRHEIMNALAKYHLSIVIFVFGHRNGRIADEDLVAFNAITDAYQFHPDSLLIFINGIPNDHPIDYFEKTGNLIQQLTNVKHDQICFIETTTSKAGKEELHQTLHEILSDTPPNPHQKKGNIILITDELSQLKAVSKQKQDQLSAQQQECSNRSRPTEFDAPVDMPSTISTQKPLGEQQLQSNYQVMIGQNQQFQQWFDQQAMSPLPAVEGNLSHPNIELRLQLAERLQSDSERNAGRIDQLQIARRIIIMRKESYIIPGPIRRLGKYVWKKLPDLRPP